MKHQFTLKILAQDIWDNTYTDAFNCPITKALERAGLKLMECGTTIETNMPIGAKRICVGDTPDELTDMVCAMYSFKNKVAYASRGSHRDTYLIPIPPADFEYVVILDIPDNMS